MVDVLAGEVLDGVAVSTVFQRDLDVGIRDKGQGLRVVGEADPIRVELSENGQKGPGLSGFLPKRPVSFSGRSTRRHAMHPLRPRTKPASSSEYWSIPSRTAERSIRCSVLSR
jgi:hypothetical protein